ncbi:putative endonuclease 4 [uncultured delta proteobacterium]|uniref:Probable endonuclease 4 n=1 Tax=uncultured delta proteobacterium TaxID=34034 RepID=A0A212KAE3_9DELT|nr:putative endonuclease 4 [uncultured delta proteobacterium]
MLNIGCHLSTTKGYLAMGKEALRIGASTFQFFTRNPRGAKAKALDPADVAAFNDLAKKHGLGPIMGHSAYTLNPAAADGRPRDFAREFMADDIERLEQTPGAYYNIHPGRHPKPDSPAAAANVADALNAVMRPGQKTLVLLETMAGGGSEVGGRFATLRAIIDGVAFPDRLGVCLDTCHVFAAGYDIVNDLDGVLRDFDAAIGLGRLRAVHCNDSKFPLASGKDRHANIGEGHIGLEGFRRIVTHPALKDLPFYLETHNEPDGYGREIALLRELAG